VWHVGAKAGLSAGKTRHGRCSWRPDQDTRADDHRGKGPRPPQAATARKSRRGLLAAVASTIRSIIVCEASRSWFDKVSSMGPSPPPSRSNRVEEANENAPTFESRSYASRVWTFLMVWGIRSRKLICCVVLRTGNTIAWRK